MLGSAAIIDGSQPISQDAARDWLAAVRTMTRPTGRYSSAATKLT